MLGRKWKYFKGQGGLKTEKTISKEEQPVQEHKQKQSENTTDSIGIQKKEPEKVKRIKKAIQKKKKGGVWCNRNIIFAFPGDRATAIETSVHVYRKSEKICWWHPRKKWAACLSLT